MSDDSTDVYEDPVDSDSNDVRSYFPFIKIENDGTVFIDGQPSNQDASEMSIEAAEVLVLPYRALIEQLETFEDTDTHFNEIAPENAENPTKETIADHPKSVDDPDSDSEHLHDHNYEDIRVPDPPKPPARKKKNYSYLVKQLESYGNICSLCEKSFNSSGSLRRHERTHTGERPYQCQVCNKFFSQQSNLWKHVRTHTGERPFECPHCKKKFSQRANMKKHLIIHSGERPFVCYLCEKGFTQQANLSKHMRLHTGERPYGCSYCDKRFSQRSNLQKHEHLHEGIKPYTCEICYQAFTQQSNLRKHEMMHTNVRKYLCTGCGKGYVQKISLIKHTQRCVIRTNQLSNADPETNEKIIRDQMKMLKNFHEASECLEFSAKVESVDSDEEFYVTCD